MTIDYRKLLNMPNGKDWNHPEIWDNKLKEVRKACKHKWEDAGTSWDGGDDKYECSICGKVEWVEWD